MLDIDQAIDTLRRGASRPRHVLSDRESEALDGLYRAYTPVLRSVAMRITGNRWDAEDVLHDVFMRLPVTIGKYEDGRFGGWLSQVTVRTALMRLRRTRRQPEQMSIESCEQMSLASDQSADCDWPIEADPLISQLPSSLRDVTRLRFFSEYSHRQIANELGISPAASEIRLCRAIKRLRVIAMKSPGAGSCTRRS